MHHAQLFGGSDGRDGFSVARDIRLNTIKELVKLVEKNVTTESDTSLPLAGSIQEKIQNYSNL